MKKMVLMLLLLVLFCGAMPAYADPVSDLLAAAWDGDTAKVTALLDSGVNINSWDKHKETALMQAVEGDNMAVVNLLLDKGARINLQNDQGDTALIMATQINSAEMVKLLLDRGADVNLKGNNSPGALGMAAMQGNVEMFNLILAKGPKDVSYPSLLEEAENGAEDAEDTGEGRLEMAHILAEKIDFTKLSDEEKNSLLPAAAAAGDLPVVQRMFEDKPDKDILAIAFAYAARKDRINILKYFLSKGVKVDIANRRFTYSTSDGFTSLKIKGGTAFAYAVAFGKKETVAFLLQNGAKVDQPVNVSYEPNKITNVEIVNGTALILAVCKGDRMMVRLLLHAGADPKAKTKDGKTALDFAKFKGDKIIIKMLQKK